MKVITICGSMRFKNEMMVMAEKLEFEGNCILTPIFPTDENAQRTEEQLEKLKEGHFKKIELSDAIFVVNVNNYIGNSTKMEIDYATRLGKEIIYYTDY